MSRTLVTILTLLLLTGCEKASYEPMVVPEQGGQLSPLLEKALQVKYDKYRANIESRCRSKAFKEAVVYVDSIIVQELSIQQIDKLGFPSRPTKPKLPEGIILNDSTDIGPI